MSSNLHSKGKVRIDIIGQIYKRTISINSNLHAKSKIKIQYKLN